MNRNNHILLYTDDPSIYGVGQYNHLILCELAKLGYRVTCVQAQASNLLIKQRQELGIQHLWLDYDTVKEFARTLTGVSDAQDIFDTVKPDILIFSDCCPLSNLAAKKVAHRMKIPYLIVEGFVAPYLAERFASYLQDLEEIYNQARAVIAVSTENLDLLHHLFRLPKTKGQVIYYGRPQKYFASPRPTVRDNLRQNFEIPTNAVVCFTAARLESVKGFQYQLEAIKQLKQTAIWSQLYFIWAGTGSLETQLKVELEQLGVTKQVKLIGERSDIADWLDTADIFILPSQLEGMPLSIMEAMAKGLPVIATAVSGIPEELGETGQLLTDPKINPQATVQELVNAIQLWTLNPESRYNQGQAAKRRAEAMFKEERMVKETVKLIEDGLLPDGDYISPGFSIIRPDICFPNMVIGDTSACGWPYLRREIPHNWYVDKRQPTVGFLSRDEAHILYNTALKFKGKKALEIGCWRGWSACHLALAGVELDVVDPLLDNPEIYESVSNSLKDAAVLDSVNLVAGYSPQKVEELAKQLHRKWSLIFIDGDHDAPGPLNDAIICEQLAEEDALILFHDLSSPDVAQGLDYLRQRGWNTMVYQTMQIMGVAWRGNVEPVQHQPDSKVNWNLPKHLQNYLISNQFKISSVNSYQSTYVIKNNKGFIPPQSLPLVSVVIPCYKQAHFLPESVASVVSQTYENWEIIIVSDGSPDNTIEVSQRLIEAYSNKTIRLITKSNGGPASARNAGIRVANGEYILPLDADDKLSSRAIDHLLKVILNQDFPCISFGSYETFGIENKLVVSYDLFSEANLKRLNMLHPSSLYPKQVWDLINGYKEDSVLIGYEDWEFWINCLKHKIKFYGSKELVVYYRKNNNSTGEQAFLQHYNKFSAIVAFNSEIFNPKIMKEANHLLLSFGLIKETHVPKQYLEGILNQIPELIEQYKKNPNIQSEISNLIQIRHNFAETLLSLSLEELVKGYLTYLSNVYQELVNSGIKNELLTENDESFVDYLLENISKGFEDPKAIQYLLAAMLYCRADQLPLQYDLTDIPQWLLDDYLKFIFESPRLFQEKGEVDNYYHYLKQWLDYLHEHILSNPESELWQYIANFFLQNANFIPLYFSTENLKEIYTKRADIMEYALKIQGYEIDYEFPDVSLERKKIRLGILAAHYNPQTETFTTLPVYKHLNRDVFEIILYTLNSNNHRLERYCAGHADFLITLPQHLSSQVQVIREDELDILLIGTNVTAVTNQVALLALHRLARIQIAINSSCVTTGMSNVDYYISGKLTEPENDAQQQYRETLITIDCPAHCHDFATEENILPTITVNRESLGLANNEIVYISGANFYKIIPEVEEAWAKIIAKVPNSKLVLYPFNPNWSSSYPIMEFRRRIISTFAECGIAEEKLIILNPVPNRVDVKERLKIADVYLDSFPFSSINSLIDPLEVGLPIIIRDGNLFRSLMGAALLRDLKVENLITDTEESYIELAVNLGNNPELRQQKSDAIKAAMNNNPSFLDSRSYSAKMGNLFQELFRTYISENLEQNLRLRDINLIIFPDWTQSEDELGFELQQVIQTLATNPNNEKITLIIYVNDFSLEDAEIFLSSVAMNLLMEDLDISDTIDISLVGTLGDIQWQSLLPRIHGRVILDNEDKVALTQAPVSKLESYQIDGLTLCITKNQKEEL